MQVFEVVLKLTDHGKNHKMTIAEMATVLQNLCTDGALQDLVGTSVEIVAVKKVDN